jgi:hypothetical protein
MGARTIRRRFNVPVERGVRIRPSTILAGNVLNIAEIRTVFGPLLATRHIRSSG